MTRKVLFYTHALVDGGGERLWACLATAFKARGYDVIFAEDFPADDNRNNLDPSIPVTTLGRGHFRAVLHLASLLRKEKPDIALSAISGSNAKLLLAKLLAFSPVRTVITYHGFVEWKLGIAAFATYVFLPILSTLADRTVAVSDGLRDKLIRTWHSRKAKTITLLNPVFYPPAAPVPPAAELAARPDVVLSVGRIVPEKDYVTLVRAFAKVANANSRLVILGKGPEESVVNAEIDRLGLRDRVTLPGYTPEPWRYYQSAKCFALSSRSEMFGNVIVEAMAYGLPVVATACNGPAEILGTSGEFGSLVPVGDDTALASAITAALAKPGDPRTRRARAEAFSFEARVPSYERLVAEILGDPLPATERTNSPQPA